MNARWMMKTVTQLACASALLWLTACASQHPQAMTGPQCLSARQSLRAVPESARPALQSMHQQTGANWFYALVATAASLQKEQTVTAAQVQGAVQFGVPDNSVALSMLALKRALIAAGLPNANGYHSADPYRDAVMSDAVLVSTFDPEPGSAYTLPYYYIAYDFGVDTVSVLVPPGNLCRLTPEEFRNRGMGKVFLVLKG